MVSQKSTVVKTKHFQRFRWLLKKVRWLKQNTSSDFRGYSQKYGGQNQTLSAISVVSQKSTVVKTKHFQRFRVLVKKVRWLKQNTFSDFGGYSKRYGG